MTGLVYLVQFELIVLLVCIKLVNSQGPHFPLLNTYSYKFIKSMLTPIEPVRHGPKYFMPCRSML